MSTLHSDCKSSIKSSTVDPKELQLSPSAKLYNETIKIQKAEEKLLKNESHNLGPDTDPSETPDKICLQLLYVYTIYRSIGACSTSVNDCSANFVQPNKILISWELPFGYRINMNLLQETC